MKCKICLKNVFFGGTVIPESNVHQPWTPRNFILICDDCVKKELKK